MDFELLDDQPIETRAGEPLASFYQLSPFVWRQDGLLHAMIRAVPRDDDPAIAPGPGDEDRDGCEDPTVAVVGDTTYVHYTGWNQERRRGALMLACGPGVWRLRKRGVTLSSQPQCLNPKEAEIARGRDGTWRLFFEFATGDASRVGVARSAQIEGPWQVCDPPFDRRAESWDSWHLSTGPVIAVHGNPLMFYNGATQSAKWRIGWILFDRDYSAVVARCETPLVTPPQPKGDETDIAFAASAVTDGGVIRLYYSIADQYMRRASLRVVP